MNLTVYVDESGNGGLFDNEQPVFALSAVAIEEDVAKRLREKYLPESLVGTGELKHDSLSKRLRNNIQKRLGDLQEELLRNHLAFSYVIPKRFFVIAKMMMDCRAGEDPRAWHYQEDARCLYYHYDEICWKCDFEGVLKAYVAAVGLTSDDEKFPIAFSRFVDAARVAISQWSPLYYYLGDIARYDKACVEEFLANPGKYMHASMLVGLVNVLFSEDQRDIDVICDDSPQFESVEGLFSNTPLSGHVRTIRTGKSDDYYGIQLADLLSGGARYVGERQLLGLGRSEKEKPYVDRLDAAYPYDVSFLHGFEDADVLSNPFDGDFVSYAVTGRQYSACATFAPDGKSIRWHHPQTFELLKCLPCPDADKEISYFRRQGTNTSASVSGMIRLKGPSVYSYFEYGIEEANRLANGRPIARAEWQKSLLGGYINWTGTFPKTSIRDPRRFYVRLKDGRRAFAMVQADHKHLVSPITHALLTVPKSDIACFEPIIDNSYKEEQCFSRSEVDELWQQYQAEERPEWSKLTLLLLAIVSFVFGKVVDHLYDEHSPGIWGLLARHKCVKAWFIAMVFLLALIAFLVG